MNDTKKAHPQHRLARIAVIGSLVILPVGLFAAPAFADTPTAVDHSVTQDIIPSMSVITMATVTATMVIGSWHNQDPGRWNQNQNNQ